MFLMTWCNGWLKRAPSLSNRIQLQNVNRHHVSGWAPCKPRTCIGSCSCQGGAYIGLIAQSLFMILSSLVRSMWIHLCLAWKWWRTRACFYCFGLTICHWLPLSQRPSRGRVYSCASDVQIRIADCREFPPGTATWFMPSSPLWIYHTLAVLAREL